jgi:hypothetical protein
MGVVQTSLWKFKMDVAYMSSAERGMFKRLRDSGAVTFFDCEICKTCRSEVPKGKRFCSQDCQEKFMITKVSKGKWVDDLVASVNRYVRLETSDGCVRQGKMTDFRVMDVEINGVKVGVLSEIELNGDRGDSIPLSRLAKITVNS